MVLTPEDGELKVHVCGDLAGILRIATNAKTPVAKKPPQEFPETV